MCSDTNAMNTSRRRSVHSSCRRSSVATLSRNGRPASGAGANVSSSSRQIVRSSSVKIASLLSKYAYSAGAVKPTSRAMSAIDAAPKPLRMKARDAPIRMSSRVRAMCNALRGVAAACDAAPACAFRS